MTSGENTTSYSDYYEESLHKLQNGVLNIVKTSETPFYLTGGTALSRGYYKHSFVNPASLHTFRIDSPAPLALIEKTEAELVEKTVRMAVEYIS